MTEVLTGLLHPSNKKRLTAEEALDRLRSDYAFDDNTKGTGVWPTSMDTVSS